MAMRRSKEGRSTDLGQWGAKPFFLKGSSGRPDCTRLFAVIRHAERAGQGKEPK